MIQTKTRWKLGAMLLVAPLLVPAVAHANYDQNYNSDQLRSTLKDVLKWRNAQGEIYLFRQNGEFERRVGRDRKFKTFAREFGRFTVRPATKEDNLPAADKVVLQLNVTSFVPKDGKSRQARTATYISPLRAMSRYADGSGGNDTGAGGPDIFYLKIGGDRFDNGRS